MAAKGKKSTSSMSSSSKVSATLAASGFDICHEFDAAWYNKHIEDENLQQQLKPVPMFGRSSALSFLIGNTRHFWPVFLAWLKAEFEKDNNEKLIENPIDSYVHSSLAAIVRSHFHDDDEATNYKIFWSDSSCDQQQQLVSMQHVALVSGLCYHDDQIHLSIHPEFGPWIAFRAIVVLDRPFVSSQQQQRPPLVPCLLSPTEQQNARKAMEAALAVSYRVNRSKQLKDWSKDEEVNRAWIALRDCITTGRNYRYSDVQLAYHYTKDAKILMKEFQQQAA